MKRNSDRKVNLHNQNGIYAGERAILSSFVRKGAGLFLTHSEVQMVEPMRCSLSCVARRAASARLAGGWRRRPRAGWCAGGGSGPDPRQISNGTDLLTCLSGHPCLMPREALGLAILSGCTSPTELSALPRAPATGKRISQ
jgi:hypothetical protein